MDLLTYPQRNRMPCLLVHGRTGMGKTMILRKFCREHPTVVDPHLGLARSPVVMMQLPPEPVEVSFYEELLGALGFPLIGEVSRVRARRMARDALKIIGARILIIGQAPGSKVHASGVPWDQSPTVSGSGHRVRRSRSCRSAATVSWILISNGMTSEDDAIMGARLLQVT